MTDDDIVTRLHDVARYSDAGKAATVALIDAANEITRLRTDLAAARAEKELAYKMSGELSEKLYQTTVERDAAREALKEAREAIETEMVKQHQAFTECESIVQYYDWEEDLKQTDMCGLVENMRHTIKGARDAAITNAEYWCINNAYRRNAGQGSWWEKSAGLDALARIDAALAKDEA